MGASLHEHRRNEDILKGSDAESFVVIMRIIRLERIGYVNRGTEKETRAATEMKMLVKQANERHMF